MHIFELLSKPKGFQMLFTNNQKILHLNRCAFFDDKSYYFKPDIQGENMREYQFWTMINTHGTLHGCHYLHQIPHNTFNNLAHHNPILVTIQTINLTLINNPVPTYPRHHQAPLLPPKPWMTKTLPKIISRLVIQYIEKGDSGLD